MARSGKIDLALQTLFSELSSRAHDADFSEPLNPRGAIKRKKRGNRYYWYWQYRDGEKVIQKYIGPAAAKDVTERIKRLESLKTDYDARREMVKSLVAAGLPTPNPYTGDIIGAMAGAGFFRLRGVLVGTTAYQCYSGMLGAKLPAATLSTQDADFAQFFAISQKIDDSMPQVIEVLQEVDPTFREVPHLTDPHAVTAYVSDEHRYRVEFLTPNRGSDEYLGKPAQMPALGGASAEPLRFLDFLIHKPVRSVLLNDAGVSVVVPSPERYALHKLIVSRRRREGDRSKVEKDLNQAQSLIEALCERYALDLSEAWQEAWERGPTWRDELTAGLDSIGEEVTHLLRDAIARGAKRRRRDVSKFWPS